MCLEEEEVIDAPTGTFNEKSDTEKTEADEESNSKNKNQSSNPNEQGHAKVKHWVLSPDRLVLNVIYGIYGPGRKVAMVVDILQIPIL